MSLLFPTEDAFPNFPQASSIMVLNASLSLHRYYLPVMISPINRVDVFKDIKSPGLRKSGLFVRTSPSLLF